MAPSEPFPAGADARFLAAGAVLLNVSHADVAVEARSVLDLEPADHDVAAEPRVLAEGQLGASGDGALDIALDGHVGRLDRDPCCRSLRDVEISRDVDLAFSTTIDVDAAVIHELAFETVVRTHRDLTLPVSLAIAIVIGGSHVRAFRHCLLNVHQL